ncbi:MAG: hypothetical protein AMS27_05890 [Bacteroides sp. SM23_62_1]|nr:MAG: hypothetical protein AMS27_05890 [Bacteroides sp. SM23_62_1]
MIQRKIRLIVLGIIILLGIIFVSFREVKIVPVKPATDIPEKLNTYYKQYPQQKVYMHFDKQIYQAGENIWFSVYFLDATTHIPSSHCNTLIVEFVNSFGQTTMTRLLKMENGYAHGDFTIFDSIPTGLYEIRAYSNWMRNFGDDFFFRRQISVMNPDFSDQLYRDEKLANKKLKKKSIRKSGKTDIQFFPEGGYLVDGIESRVAFKAINELGLGVEVHGEIFNKKEERITEFNTYHQGMGEFRINPEVNEKYYALVNLENNRKEKINLPEPLPSGYILDVNNRSNKEILVKINSTFTDPELILIGHTRGHIFYHSNIRLESGQAEIKIPADLFPTGILNLTLFDNRSQPLCERLVFVNHNDLLNVDIEPDKEIYGTRQKISLKITIRDKDNNPVEGNFSLAVSDREMNNFSGDFYSGISSYLLLVSDLKGRIQNPGYYFEKNTPETRQALDLLMMTQGWRRFVWNNVIAEIPLEINYPVEKGLSVQGKITREFFNIPLKNIPVTLTVKSNFNDIYYARSNDKGKYVFYLPDYKDTVNVEITASRPSGRKNLIIHIDEAEFPESGVLYTSYTKEMAITGTNAFRPYEEPQPDPDNPRIEGIHGEPDNVIYVDDNLATYPNVFEIIKGRVPGVSVTGNSIQIRGINSFMASTEPLYLVDGVPVNVEAVGAVNPYDIERIEILKGPSTAIYGSRGANGVIAIYTKRGRFMKKGILEFKMLGYYNPKEFYSPKYGTEFDYLYPDDRITLFWTPTIVTDSLGYAEAVFFSSDRTGVFNISLEGVDPKGNIGAGHSSFTIR